jgi:putative transposase
MVKVLTQIKSAKGKDSMARLPRLYASGCAQHIIQRGNNRHACFFNDVDYTVYLDKLKEYSEKYAVDIHTFVLMTNHVHILLTPHDKEGIPNMMQSLGRYYVRYINTVYQRTGSLWEQGNQGVRNQGVSKSRGQGC